jgi:hypothetical protein
MSDPTILTQAEKPLNPETAIYSYVRAILGAPNIALELTNKQLDVFLQHSLELYSRKIPKIRWFAIPAYAGIQQYYLKKDTIGYGIIQVMIPRLDPIAPLLLSSGPRLDIFGYRYSYPYRDINELYIDYVYFKEATRVLSADFDWEFIDGALEIYPQPDEPFTLTYASAFPRDLGSMPRDDIDWLKTHVMAQSKIAIGHARSKFRVPGSMTEQTLDGQFLLQQGAKELEAAEMDLEERTPPFPLHRT